MVRARRSRSTGCRTSCSPHGRREIGPRRSSRGVATFVRRRRGAARVQQVRRTDADDRLDRARHAAAAHDRDAEHPANRIGVIYGLNLPNLLGRAATCRSCCRTCRQRRPRDGVGPGDRRADAFDLASLPAANKADAGGAGSGRSARGGHYAWDGSQVGLSSTRPRPPNSRSSRPSASVTSGGAVADADGATPRESRVRAVGREPVRGSAQLRLDLPAAANASVTLYDVSGRAVRIAARRPVEAGAHAWDLRDESGAAVGNGVILRRVPRGRVEARGAGDGGAVGGCAAQVSPTNGHPDRVGVCSPSIDGVGVSHRAMRPTSRASGATGDAPSWRVRLRHGFGPEEDDDGYSLHDRADNVHAAAALTLCGAWGDARARHVHRARPCAGARSRAAYVISPTARSSWARALPNSALSGFPAGRGGRRARDRQRITQATIVLGLRRRRGH